MAGVRPEGHDEQRGPALRKVGQAPEEFAGAATIWTDRPHETRLGVGTTTPQPRRRGRRAAFYGEGRNLPVRYDDELSTYPHCWLA